MRNNRPITITVTVNGRSEVVYCSPGTRLAHLFDQLALRRYNPINPGAGSQITLNQDQGPLGTQCLQDGDRVTITMPGFSRNSSLHT